MVMLMGSKFVSDLLVGNATWSRELGLNLAVRHNADGWVAALVEDDGEPVIVAERAYLDETLVELYTAAQTAHLRR
jgi:hypothetical protein